MKTTNLKTRFLSDLTLALVALVTSNSLAIASDSQDHLDIQQATAPTHQQLRDIHLAIALVEKTDSAVGSRLRELLLRDKIQVAPTDRELDRRDLNMLILGGVKWGAFTSPTLYLLNDRERGTLRSVAYERTRFDHQVKKYESYSKKGQITRQEYQRRLTEAAQTHTQELQKSLLDLASNLVYLDAMSQSNATVAHVTKQFAQQAGKEAAIRFLKKFRTMANRSDRETANEVLYYFTDDKDKEETAGSARE